MGSEDNSEIFEKQWKLKYMDSWNVN